MSSYDTQNINVLNYNENEVYVNSSKEKYKFSASRDGITPSIIPMPLSELQAIASNTDIIITGWLTFDEEIKEEIFKDLRIPNWEDILSNDDIKSILTNPTIDGLQKILDITNQTYFDRVRIVMFKLLSQGVDITTKVSELVKYRYDELRRKQRKTSIVLSEKNVEKYATPDEVKELQTQNQQLQEQMLEMKKMMEQMLANNKTPVNQEECDKNSEAPSVVDSKDSEPQTKKRGRPSTKNKTS